MIQHPYGDCWNQNYNNLGASGTSATYRWVYQYGASSNTVPIQSAHSSGPQPESVAPADSDSPLAWLDRRVEELRAWAQAA